MMTKFEGKGYVHVKPYYSQSVWVVQESSFFLTSRPVLKHTNSAWAADIPARTTSHLLEECSETKKVMEPFNVNELKERKKIHKTVWMFVPLHSSNTEQSHVFPLHYSDVKLEPFQQFQWPEAYLDVFGWVLDTICRGIRKGVEVGGRLGTCFSGKKIDLSMRDVV